MLSAFFISSYIPLSNKNLRSFLVFVFVSGNKRDGIKTLTQCKTWPQFVVKYFFGNRKFQLFEITLKHYSEAVCTLLLLAASAAIAGSADTWDSKHTLTSRCLPPLATLCY